jgi:serine protease AprX
VSSRRHSPVARWIATAALFLAVGTVGSRPLLGDSGSSGGHRAKLDRHLHDVKGKASESVRVIVRTAKGKQTAVADRLERRGRTRAGELASLNAFVADVTGSDVAELERDPDVLGVSTDAVVSSFGTSLDSASAGAMLDEILGVESMRWSGDKIGIAVVDSGLERGRDLDGGRTDKFFDLTNGKNDKAFDDYGHGTHVAGLIGGTGKRSLVKRAMREANGSTKVRDVAVFAGVAPRARLLSFKVLDENGAGYTSQVIDAIDYIVDNKDRLKVDIINL